MTHQLLELSLYLHEIFKKISFIMCLCCSTQIDTTCVPVQWLMCSCRKCVLCDIDMYVPGAPGGFAGKYQINWHDAAGSTFVMDYYPKDCKQDVSAPDFALPLKELERGQAYVVTNVDWVASKSK